MPLTKTYALVHVRRESKDIMAMELLDETSTPLAVKTAILRIGMDEYKALGYPNPATAKITIALIVEETKAEEKPPAT